MKPLKRPKRVLARATITLTFFLLIMFPSLSLRGAPNDSGSRGLLQSGLFPIGVWLQDPSLAAAYRAAGINLYVGLWQGPSEEQLALLKKAGMQVVCSQNAIGLLHNDDPTIVGWMQQDEPDNAQPIVDPQTGKQSGYGPCVPPPAVISTYRGFKVLDPTRPVLLNLGEGVANDSWIGRGSGAQLSDYATYVDGGDIVSFDVYPVAGLNDPDKLWYVGKGLDRLSEWTHGGKPLWEAIECTGIATGHMPTPDQVRSEIWMALIHGATGIIYFCHQFTPSFDAAALLHEPDMLAAVTKINREIRDLSPDLLGSSVVGVVSVRSSNAAVPIDIMVKRGGDHVTIFAVGMRNAPTDGSFTVRGLPPDSQAVVIGEDRAIPVRDGVFSDSFAPFGSHTYRIEH